MRERLYKVEQKDTLHTPRVGSLYPCTEVEIAEDMGYEDDDPEFEPSSERERVIKYLKGRGWEQEFDYTPENNGSITFHNLATLIDAAKYLNGD